MAELFAPMARGSAMRSSLRWLLMIVALVAVAGFLLSRAGGGARRLEFSRHCPGDDFTFTVLEDSRGAGTYQARLEYNTGPALEASGHLDRTAMDSLFAGLEAAGAWEIQDSRGSLFRRGWAAGNEYYELRMRDGPRTQDARFFSSGARDPGTRPLLHAAFSGPVGRTCFELMKKKKYNNLPYPPYWLDMRAEAALPAALCPCDDCRRVAWRRSQPLPRPPAATPAPPSR